MQLIIDGFEDDLVRLETSDARQLVIPRIWLPLESRAGDHITVDADQTGLVQFSLDVTATRVAFEKAQTALTALTASDTGGDVAL